MERYSKLDNDWQQCNWTSFEIRNMNHYTQRNTMCAQLQRSQLFGSLQALDHMMLVWPCSSQHNDQIKPLYGVEPSWLACMVSIVIHCILLYTTGPNIHAWLKIWVLFVVCSAGPLETVVTTLLNIIQLSADPCLSIIWHKIWDIPVRQGIYLLNNKF